MMPSDGLVTHEYQSMNIRLNSHCHEYEKPQKHQQLIKLNNIFLHTPYFYLFGMTEILMILSIFDTNVKS